jgi:hypothetical protein
MLAVFPSLETFSPTSKPFCDLNADREVSGTLFSVWSGPQSVSCGQSERNWGLLSSRLCEVKVFV